MTKKILYRVKRVVKNLVMGGGGQLSIKEFREYGVKIGSNCHIYTNAIDLTHGYLISIGNNVTISHAEILAHDASTMAFLGYSKVGRVDIGNNVFIGAKSIILPGVSIGNNVIIGAGSVVSKSIPSNTVAVGCPCEVICTYQEYVDKNELLFKQCLHQNTSVAKKTNLEKEQMLSFLEHNRFCFDK